MAYKLTPSVNETEPSRSILRLSDNAFIPMDEGNTDYQEYLKWVTKGGVPEPADE
jgi:hypothetical protein